MVGVVALALWLPKYLIGVYGVDVKVAGMLAATFSLSASLFMHEGRDVFVTFSAGVTLYRAGETLEAALDRADEALYEAKRTGKNRTCVA